MSKPQQQSTLLPTTSVINNVNNLISPAKATFSPSAPTQSAQNGIFANMKGPQNESTLPNTFGGHLVGDSTAPLTGSSSANMQKNISMQMPNGNQDSADTVSSDQVLNTALNSTETSLTDDQIATAMPPSIPAGFTTAQARQYVTAYRMRSLNESFRVYVNQNASSFQALSTDAFRFYQEQKREILASGGLPSFISGIKRKSDDISHDNGVTPQVKQVNVNGTLVNGENPDVLLSRSGTANNKRKADEIIFKEADAGSSSGTAKKARCDSVIYPSLPSAQTSETASLFKSIANNNEIGSKPKTTQHNLVNGQNGPQSLKPVELSVSQPAPELSAGGNGLNPENTLQSTQNQGRNSPKSELAAKSISNQSIFVNNAASTLSSAGASIFKPSQSAQLFTSSIGNNTLTTAAPSAALPAFTFGSTVAPSTVKPADSKTNTTTDKTSSTATKSGTSSGLSLPKFSTSNANYMAQFGQAAKKTEKEEKAKRKAETFDSDEEDEAEWERKDEEEQRAKRQKIEQVKQVAQAEGFKFVIRKSTHGPAQTQEHQAAMSQFKYTPSVSGKLFDASGPATSTFPTGSTASNANDQAPQVENGNIFGYLSAQGSDAEGSKTGDADNEASDEDEQENSPPQPTNAAASGAVVSGAVVSGATAPGTAASGAAASAAAAASGAAAPDATVSGAVAPVELTNSSGSSGVSTPRSLFDRIETNADGTPKREVPPPSEKEKENSTAIHSLFSDKGKKALNASWTAGGSSIFSQVPASQNSASNIFGSSSSGSASKLFSQTLGAPAALGGSTLFGLTSGTPATSGGTSTLFSQAAAAPAPFTGFVSPFKDKDAAKDTSSTSPQLDRTWKADSPIKFSGTSNAPSVNVTAPSPLKPAFTEPKPAPLTNLFGSAKTDGQSNTSQPQSNLFRISPITTSGGSVGFQFASSPAPNLFASLAPTSALNSAATSRATSPGASTGAESANEGNEDSAPPEAQIDLATTRAGEEDENILFEAKAKALEYGRDPAKFDEDKTTKEKIPPSEEWLVRGVGSLRVLKHRETGKTRIILRAGPGGKIILNTALISGTNYKLARDKSVMFMAATKAGTLAKWTITVGKKDDATRLASILEQNKSN